MKINVLVTAGGTSEDIDAVRCITNRSTGRLGSLIAQQFISGGANVTYLCSENAARPSLNPEKTLTITGTASLAAAFERLLQQNAFDCVVHAMAVSDFTPRATLTLEDFTAALEKQLTGGQALASAISAALSTPESSSREGKISSGSGLLLNLTPTPKIISMVKTLQPGTLLVGFKLLCGAGQPELISASKGLIQQNGCDFVLANALEDITESSHKALLLGDGGEIVGTPATKPEIARLIFDTITQKLETT